MDEARGNGERKALLKLIEAELPRLLLDLALVDRGLVLARGRVRGSQGRRADFVFLDDAGCALIALTVDGREDETVLAAIDALAFARQSGDALTRPKYSPPTREGVARVALVAETFSARIREALSLLPERELLLFEARRVNSDSGSRTCLVRLDPIPARSTGSPASRESFLATIPESLRGTAELLLRRLSRIDAGVQSSFTDGAAIFRCGTQDLCTLDLHEGVLRGAIRTIDRRLPIRGMDDADAFLDEVLREHLRRLEASWGVEAPPEESSSRLQEAPLLTPEEIAAFLE